EHEALPALDARAGCPAAGYERARVRLPGTGAVHQRILSLRASQPVERGRVVVRQLAAHLRRQMSHLPLDRLSGSSARRCRDADSPTPTAGGPRRRTEGATSRRSRRPSPSPAPARRRPGDATEPASNGYRLTVACACGVVFERWVTPQEAYADL